MLTVSDASDPATSSRQLPVCRLPSAARAKPINRVHNAVTGDMRPGIGVPVVT
jgi:hypothetical protein